MAENRDQTRQRSGGPSLKLYEYLLPGGKVRIQGVVTNPPQPPPTYIIFSFQGVEHEEPIRASGSATFEVPDIPPGKYKFLGVVPEAGNISADVDVTVPAGRELLIADKMIVHSEGKDGHHTVYISVVTQDKKPVPGIHIVVKDRLGNHVGEEGITNERGVIHPHPVIKLKAPGINDYTVFAEGTALAPEPLRLDGPPRYPKPPTPPEVILPEEKERIRWWNVLYMGWKAGRKALREQQEKARGLPEQQVQEEELP